MSQFMEAGATKQDPSKDFEKLIGEQGEIINVIEQMKSLDPKMINKIRTKLLTKIDNLLNILMEPLKQKIIDEYMKGDGFDKKIMANIKNECNSIKKQIQPLIDAVSGLVSVKGTSNKKQNLKRLMRTEKRNANVSKALTMSMNEKFEILEKNCQIIGCLMIEINSSRIKPLFQNFILDNFIESTDIISIDDRSRTLSADVVSSLLEVCSGMEHYLKGKDSIALPKQCSSNSNIPILLCDKYIKCRDPSKINWIDESNEEYVAIFRILLRGTVANCVDSRINARDNQLGYFLIHAYLCAGESFVKNMTNIPNPETDFDNSVCQIMRGLMGQILTLMASTLNVLCCAYQYVHKDFPVKVMNNNKHWIFLLRMYRLWPYTCWDPTNIQNNIKRCLVKIAARYSESAIKQIHDGVKAKSKVKGDPNRFRLNKKYNSNRMEILKILTSPDSNPNNEEYYRAIWGYLKYFRFNFAELNDKNSPISLFFKYHCPNKNNKFSEKNDKTYRQILKNNITRLYRACIRQISGKAGQVKFDPSNFLPVGKTFSTVIDESNFKTERDFFKKLDTYPKVWAYFRQLFNENLIEESNKYSDDSEAIVKVETNPLLEMLQYIPYSEKAQEIVKYLPELKVNRLNQLEEQFVIFSSFVTEKKSDDLFRDITETLIEEYKNPEEATKEAIKTCF